MAAATKTTTHLQIGSVTRPHGVRGELKVRLHHAGSTALWEVASVVLEGPKGAAERYDIESVRGSEKGPILALRGVAGRDEADKLRGYAIWVERSAIEPLAEGEYYLIDLIGCELRFEGETFATIVDVRPDPSVDTLVITKSDGKGAEVPLVDAWIGKVDTSQKTVELLTLDGVIED
jgi:16S rRNA processing protein RimM